MRRDQDEVISQTCEGEEAGGRSLWPALNIAHRGAGGEAPENTLAAFELALRQGAGGIELDVHLSSDGLPVVIHDPRLSRTTSGSGWVGEHQANALRRLDAGSWFNRRFPEKARSRYVGAKIPLLSEVLAWVRQHKILALVEIKGGGRAYPGIEGKVLEEIERAGVRRLATIVSFDLATLRRVRELDSRVSLGLDVSRSLLAIRRVRSLAGKAVLPHWAIASRGFIRRAHEHSIRVFPWTVDRPAQMERRIADGVDGIITNYPARLAEVLSRVESSDRQEPGARIQKSGDRKWVGGGI
ncbi:MAG: glycerophosphodiester phosphodiesterase [Terriglobia bacterium]